MTQQSFSQICKTLINSRLHLYKLFLTLDLDIEDGILIQFD